MCVKETRWKAMRKCETNPMGRGFKGIRDSGEWRVARGNENEQTKPMGPGKPGLWFVIRRSWLVETKMRNKPNWGPSGPWPVIRGSWFVKDQNEETNPISAFLGQKHRWIEKAKPISGRRGSSYGLRPVKASNKANLALGHGRISLGPKRQTNPISRVFKQTTRRKRTVAIRQQILSWNE